MGWYHRPRHDRCLNHAWFAHGVWVCPANRHGTDNIGSGIHGNISVRITGNIYAPVSGVTIGCGIRRARQRRRYKVPRRGGSSSHRTTRCKCARLVVELEATRCASATGRA